MALQNFGAKVRKFCLSYPFFNLFSSLGDVRRRFRSAAEKELCDKSRELLAQRKRTSSNSPFRQKIPALKPPLIKGLKMFCTQFFVTLAFAEVK